MSSVPYMDDDALHALIDGELDAEHARLVEARINADPTLARRVEKFLDDKKMLKTAFGPLIERPVPEAWLALARGEISPPSATVRWQRWQVQASVAAAFLLVVFAGIGYVSVQPAASHDVVQVALDARQEAVQPAKTFAVAADENTGRFAAMLSETTALKVKTPDLQRMGYQLASIRFYGAGATKRAAELVYHDRGGRIFTVYLQRSDGAVRTDQFNRNGLRVCVWQDDQLAMVLAGHVTAAEMQRLASLSYTGLTT